MKLLAYVSMIRRELKFKKKKKVVLKILEANRIIEIVLRAIRAYRSQSSQDKQAPIDILLEKKSGRKRWSLRL